MAHAARLNLRMQKELKLLLTDPPPGVSLSEGDGSSASSLKVIEASEFTILIIPSPIITNKPVFFT